MLFCSVIQPLLSGSFYLRHLVPCYCAKRLFQLFLDNSCSNQLLKFKRVWRCSSKGSKKKGFVCCRKILNPTVGTFFEGISCRIEVRDVVAINCFVTKMQVTDAYRHLLSLRHHRSLAEIQ